MPNKLIVIITSCFCKLTIDIKVNIMKNYKKIMSAVFLASAVCYVGVVSARAFPGSLGRSNSGDAATDVYTFECSLSTKSVFLRVKNERTLKNTSSLVSVLAVKGNSASKLLTDTKADDLLPSASLIFRPASGAGVYTLLLMKSQSTTKGFLHYYAEVNCADANGVGHIGGNTPTELSNLRVVQNQ